MHKPSAGTNNPDRRRELQQAVNGFFAHWRHDKTTDQPAATFKPAFDLHGRVEALDDGWHWTAWARTCGGDGLAGGPEPAVEVAMAIVDVLLAGHRVPCEGRGE